MMLDISRDTQRTKRTCSTNRNLHCLRKIGGEVLRVYFGTCSPAFAVQMSLAVRMKVKDVYILSTQDLDAFPCLCHSSLRVLGLSACLRCDCVLSCHSCGLPQNNRLPVLCCVFGHHLFLLFFCHLYDPHVLHFCGWANASVRNVQSLVAKVSGLAGYQLLLVGPIPCVKGVLWPFQNCLESCLTLMNTTNKQDTKDESKVWPIGAGYYLGSCVGKLRMRLTATYDCLI